MILNKKERCYQGGHRHKFEPRYTEMSTGIAPTKIFGGSTTEQIEALRTMCIRKMYVGDICVWCGKVITL